MANGERDDVEKLAELIGDVKVAMLTTVDEDGSLHSRPMWTQQEEFDGQLWFFTAASSHKVREVEREHRVNLGYADPENDRYISVSGRATLIRDRSKIEDLWNPLYKAWFPMGLADPDLALLRVEVDKAEYWDTPPGRLVKLVGFAKALLTGKAYEPGAHGTVQLTG
jgi:general stress protein 26